MFNSTPVFDSTPDFDAPVFDPTTGEVLDAGTQAALTDPFPEATPVVVLDGPTELAALGIRSVDGAQGNVVQFARELGEALTARVRERYGIARKMRHVRTTADGVELPPFETEVVGELQTLADMADVLAALGKAFTAASGEARALAGEVVADVHYERNIERTGGSASIRVGSRGGTVKVTTTQPTEPFVDEAEVVDVVVADLVGTVAGQLSKARVEGYAQGARDAIPAVFGLMSPPAWKTTALGGLVTNLQSRGERDLSERLARSYGRRPKGNAQVKIERTAEGA